MAGERFSRALNASFLIDRGALILERPVSPDFLPPQVEQLPHLICGGRRYLLGLGLSLMEGAVCPLFLPLCSLWPSHSLVFLIFVSLTESPGGRDDY